MKEVFSYLKPLLFLMPALIMFTCKPEIPAGFETTEEDELAIPSVCIWDNISLRENPVKNDKITGNLSLGEEIIFTGKKAIDSTFHNQVYVQVITNEGKKMWVPQMALATKAKPAVVITQTPIYLRPDLLTLSEIELPVLEIVAVTQTQDEWICFYNEKKLKTGWIKAEQVSYLKEDISFALFAGRKLNEKNNQELTEKISRILQDNPYPNSQLVKIIREIEQKEKEKQAITDIMNEN